MLSADRQRIILDQLYEKGSVKVSELSQELGVHEETIRRDLKALAQKLAHRYRLRRRRSGNPDHNPARTRNQYAVKTK